MRILHSDPFESAPGAWRYGRPVDLAAVPLLAPDEGWEFSALAGERSDGEAALAAVAAHTNRVRAARAAGPGAIAVKSRTNLLVPTPVLPTPPQLHRDLSKIA